MIGVDESATVLLTLVEQVTPAHELLVKHHHYFILCSSNDCATQTELNVDTHRRVHIHDTVADLVVAASPRAEWRAPVGEPLCKNHIGFKTLHWFQFQVDV